MPTRENEANDSQIYSSLPPLLVLFKDIHVRIKALIESNYVLFSLNSTQLCLYKIEA